MKTLLELASIVTSKTGNKKSLLAVIADEQDGVLSSYLRSIVDRRYNDDDAAARAIYQSDRTDARYRTLKSRAFDRLLQALLLLEIRTPSYSEYVTNYHRCQRNLVVARTLVSFSSHRAATKLAEKTLHIATKFEFTEVTIHLLTLLRSSYAMLADKRRFAACNKSIRQSMELLEAELRSEELLELLQVEIRQGNAPEESLLTLARQYCGEHTELAKTHRTFTITLNQFRLEIVVGGLSQDIASVSRACDAARDYLRSRPHLNQQSRMGEFGLLKMQACVENRAGALVVDEIVDNASMFTAGGTNWYLTLEYGILSALQCGRYDVALSLWQEGRTHRRFSQAIETVQQTWQVLEAYMHLLARLQLLKEPISESRTFRVSTFLNTAPTASIHQRQQHVHSIILHAMFLILEGDNDAADRRIEYLRVYVSRYITTKRDASIRLFVRVLQALAKVNYAPDQLPATTITLIDDLATTERKALIGGSIEIVPLDTLLRQLTHVLRSR